MITVVNNKLVKMEKERDSLVFSNDSSKPYAELSLSGKVSLSSINDFVDKRIKAQDLSSKSDYAALTGRLEHVEKCINLEDYDKHYVDVAKKTVSLQEDLDKLSLKITDVEVRLNEEHPACLSRRISDLEKVVENLGAKLVKSQNSCYSDIEALRRWIQKVEARIQSPSEKEEVTQLADSPAPILPFYEGYVYEHIKTGDHYEAVTFCRREHDSESMIVYRNLATNACWVRPLREWTVDRWKQVPRYKYGRNVADFPGSQDKV